VEKAMDVVVNGILTSNQDYHLAFNTAIQKFSSVVDTIAESQKRVKEIKLLLESSKETLECKRFDFLHIWLKALQFKEMSRILDMIVELQDTHVKITQLIGDKHYLHAVRVLVASEKIINSADLVNVQALSTMRENFGKLKDNLQEVLLIELSDHLYLKTRESQSRIGKEA
jgi:exocyst complex component 4